MNEPQIQDEISVQKVWLTRRVPGCFCSGLGLINPLLGDAVSLQGGGEVCACPPFLRFYLHSIRTDRICCLAFLLSQLLERFSAGFGPCLPAMGRLRFRVVKVCCILSSTRFDPIVQSCSFSTHAL